MGFGPTLPERGSGGGGGVREGRERVSEKGAKAMDFGPTLTETERGVRQRREGKEIE
jgi:hypothetical protein